MILGTASELDDFERAAKIDVEALFFGLAIQRRRAVENGVGGIHQRVILVIAEAKALAGQIPAEDAHAGIYLFQKFGKSEMELQRLPETFAGFLVRFRADQKIQPIGMAGEKASHKVAAEISGGTCQENSHSKDAAASADRRGSSFLRRRRAGMWMLIQ